MPSAYPLSPRSRWDDHQKAGSGRVRPDRGGSSPGPSPTAWLVPLRYEQFPRAPGRHHAHRDVQRFEYRSTQTCPVTSERTPQLNSTHPAVCQSAHSQLADQHKHIRKHHNHEKWHESGWKRRRGRRTPALVCERLRHNVRPSCASSSSPVGRPLRIVSITFFINFLPPSHATAVCYPSTTSTPDSCHCSVSVWFEFKCLKNLGGLGGERVGGDVLVTGDLNGDLLQGSQCADEFLQAKPGAFVQEAGDGQGGEHDRQVRFDRLAGVVKDWTGP